MRSGQSSNLDVDRWFWSSQSASCEQFDWGGCGGNHNNFLSRAKCLEKCQTQGEKRKCRKYTETGTCVDDRSEEEIDEICSLEVSAGDCSGLEIRYYYDIETEDCQPFNFSGCQANQNNFRTLEACLDLCKVAGDVM